MIVTGHIGPTRRLEIPRGRSVAVANPIDWRVQRMTQRELVAFVAAAVDGKILLAHQVQPLDDVGCVFPALSFLHEITADARREVGTVYEYLELATGRARNGQPSFTTVRFVHVEDWLRARDMIAAETIRRERLR